MVRIPFCWLILIVSAGMSLPVFTTPVTAAELPAEWFNRAPTPDRIKAVQIAVAESGWLPVGEQIQVGALKAYELRQEDAAAAWFYIARWCELFGQSQSKLGAQWLETMSGVGGIHVRADRDVIRELPDQPVSKLISEETGAWLLGDRVFSEMFFDQITAHDCLPRVMSILEQLRKADARRFAMYAQLALAVALVYDQSPPVYWPHWQVSPAVLPRRLLAPLDVFAFLTESDARGSTLQKLGTLSAAELKYVVDISVTLPELQWAQRSVKFPLKDMVKSYEAVRYRSDRIDANLYVWPEQNYELAKILSEGGICVDQAYFATQTGKARGVPTLLFSGAGKDGRHAWFGFLGAAQKWVLDGGRYEEQRYITGESIDPQTWGALSDHELSFLSEGFRRLQPYRQSRQHQIFAEFYLSRGNKTAAAAAARKAVNFERRNIAAWELLVDSSADASAVNRETLLREAAQAMQRYPDLNARFIRSLVESLRARGEKSAAEFEDRALVRRGQVSGRSDLGVEHAAEVMLGTSPAEQIAVHRKLLQQYGVASPTDFYDRVTAPLVRKLAGEKRYAEAGQILKQARAGLNPEFGSQLDRELTELGKFKK